MGTRRRGREAALQMLYQVDLSGCSASQAIATFWPTLGAGRDGEEFANELVRGVVEHLDAIDDRIRSVSHHWRLERMARVDRNVLRLATHEILHREDVPPRVTLNEAVELAKRFGSEGSGRFVNGILDRIASEAGDVG
ncbi:MAG: transcription antitermination factor NusB [Myxococcota bacterium]